MQVAGEKLQAPTDSCGEGLACAASLCRKKLYPTSLVQFDSAYANAGVANLLNGVMQSAVDEMKFDSESTCLCLENMICEKVSLQWHRLCVLAFKAKACR